MSRFPNGVKALGLGPCECQDTLTFLENLDWETLLQLGNLDLWETLSRNAKNTPSPKFLYP